MTVTEQPPLPRPEPDISVETTEFWDAAASGELLIPHCETCGEHFWYPRTICPWCRSTSVGWTRSSGLGTVYTFTIVRRGLNNYKDATPYVVAYVEVPEGIRMLTNIVGCPVDEVTIGMPVTVEFEATPGGAHLPRFRPVSA